MSAHPKLPIVAGSERLEVTGRAALVIYLVAINADDVNVEEVAKLVANFAHGQAKLEIRRSPPAIRLDRR